MSMTYDMVTLRSFQDILNLLQSQHCPFLFDTPRRHQQISFRKTQIVHVGCFRINHTHQWIAVVPIVVAHSGIPKSNTAVGRRCRDHSTIFRILQRPHRTRTGGTFPKEENKEENKTEKINITKLTKQ